MKKKRCFTAINISKKLKQKIFNWTKEYRTKYENAKWVDKENVHITMHFLGYLEKENIEKVGEVLKKVHNINKENIKNIKIDINGVECFPNPNRAKILFLKAQDKGKLKKIQNNLAKKLHQKVNYKIEKREWIPHITIARFRNPKKLSLDQFNKFKDNFLVNSIDLMESKLSRKGPEYFILKKYHFND